MGFTNHGLKRYKLIRHCICPLWFMRALFICLFLLLSLNGFAQGLQLKLGELISYNNPEMLSRQTFQLTNQTGKLALVRIATNNKYLQGRQRLLKLDTGDRVQVLMHYNPGLCMDTQYAMVYLWEKTENSEICVDSVQCVFPPSVKSYPVLPCFIRTTVDFGVVEMGPVLSERFYLVNPTDDTVHIDQISTSCGCLSYQLSKAQVAPGDTAVIQLTYHTVNRLGPVQKSATVVLNQNPRAIVLYTGGLVLTEAEYKEYK